MLKVVPMSMLINEDVKNLCNGGGNVNGDAYYGLYYGAAGGGAIGNNVGGEEAPGPNDVKEATHKRGRWIH
jgi:hypothetical protein